MRLVTVATPEGATAAAVESEGGLLALLDERGHRYADVGALLASGPGWSSAAERTEPLDGDVRVIRPVLSPAATVCVGINYGTHVREMGRDLPTSPTLFSKLSQALTDPGASVVIPAGSTQVDYEGELVAVVGTGGREIAAEDAFDHVAGLTLMNDVTMRDFQYRSLQWFAGKSWRASTPVGPVLVTLDELPDLGERELTTTVNGELRQSGTIGDLIFDIPALVADISQFIELQPGDLIATGTPGGVGHAMDPPSYLEPGDVVEVSLDGLGTLATTFTGPP
jgi:acylpyruvate hydrolase